MTRAIKEGVALVSVVHYLGQAYSLVITGVHSCVVRHILLHTSKEQSLNESRPFRERILHIYCLGWIPPFDPEPILWHGAPSLLE